MKVLLFRQDVFFGTEKKVSIETALQVGYIMFHVHKSKKRRPTAPTADVGDSMQPLCFEGSR